LVVDFLKIRLSPSPDILFYFATPVDHEDDLSLKRYKDFRRGRSSSTSRYNRPTFQRKHREEWRCVECYLWNSIGRACCTRCGASEGVDRDGGRQTGQSSSSVSRSQPTGSMPKDDLDVFRWPPAFESSGSDYVFDPRSNMFYEPKSDFFFDCHSKLYYSNKKKAYFCLADQSTMTFEEILPEKSSGKKSMEPNAHDKGEKKKSIQIRIKSKSLSRPRQPSVPRGRSDEKLDPKRLEQIQNVEKWNNQMSLKTTMLQPRISSSLPRTLATSSDCIGSMQKVLDMAKIASQELSSRVELDLSDTKQDLKGIVSTAAGQPICVVCRRKFASVDQLRRHEQHSELHKTNIAKSKVSDTTSAVTQATPTQYQDRAKKRRLLHSDLPVVLQNKRHHSVDVLERQVVNPGFALGEQNIGNQLFQKMLSTSSSTGKATSTVSESIRDDWKRIEQLARPETSLAKDHGRGLGF